VTLMILGLVLFFAIHLLPTRVALRTSLINKMGELPYKGVYSLVALAGLVLIVMGKGQAEFISVWVPPAFMAHVTKLLMLPALILLVAAYVPSNIKAKVRHPMLAATKLWALAHLLANGDLASMLLFGSFLAYGVYDMISANKRALKQAFEKRPVYMDILVVLIGVAAYGGIAMHHGQLFGVPLF